MGSSLFGSAPKATFSTQSTILPSQNQLLNDLVGILETGDPVAGVQRYGGTYAEPLNSLQTTSLAGLESIASGVGDTTATTKTPQQTTAIDNSFNALTKALDYTAPKIDSSESFQKGVVDPLTSNFESRVLPAISSQYAGSAGGAFSSGRQQASQQAGETLNDTLASYGSKYAYDAAAANQTADLNAQTARLQALGLAPAITATPTVLDTSLSGLTTDTINQLLGTLKGGEAGRSIGQIEKAGEYGEFTRQQTEEQQIIADFIAAMGVPTVQTSGVGSGGSTGILGGALSGLSGFGGAFGNWLFGLSDERVKTGIEQVGDVDGFPLYKFKYIGENTPRLGFMAQDVERRLPAAVGRVPGTDLRTVNYGAVLESVLKEAV